MVKRRTKDSRKEGNRSILFGIAGLVVFGIIFWVLMQGESDSG